MKPLFSLYPPNMKITKAEIFPVWWGSCQWNQKASRADTGPYAARKNTSENVHLSSEKKIGFEKPGTLPKSG